jgi:hypothetical protein
MGAVEIPGNVSKRGRDRNAGLTRSSEANRPWPSPTGKHRSDRGGANKHRHHFEFRRAVIRTGKTDTEHEREDDTDLDLPPNDM